MRGERKQYSDTHGIWGSAGEDTVAVYLRACGHTVTQHPDGRLGVDAETEIMGELVGVETERRTAKTWGQGLFPYPTVNIPERRDRYENETFFITLRADMKVGVVTPNALAKRYELRELSNRFVKHGELFHMVPTHLVMNINLEHPVWGKLSDRYRQQMTDRLTSAGLRHLDTLYGPSLPYFNSNQWDSLKPSRPTVISQLRFFQ